MTCLGLLCDSRMASNPKLQLLRYHTTLTDMAVPGPASTGWLSLGTYTISACNQPTRSTQPCIPPGSLNRVPASAGVRAGMSPLPGARWHCMILYGMWVSIAVRVAVNCHTLYLYLPIKLLNPSSWWNTTYLYKWTMFSNSLVRMSVLASWSVLAFSRASCSLSLLSSTYKQHANQSQQWIKRGRVHFGQWVSFPCRTQAPFSALSPQSEW